ncbi:saccharopine dehydrogenase family protein [Roseiarcus sp.]|uniref:saccharopine dehydrogenase family protein n=1 Tax=Roseiarcus sp. TaxID=1969460 RepID=UPI003F95414D
MSGTILIYGATGYTGKLIAKTAAAKGARPILAGRDREKVEAIAKQLGFAARGFDLRDRGRIDAAIKDVSVVLCVAGPFSTTSKPVADACLRNRVHYLDITGEIEVFEALAARDAEAKARGVALLPGVGFDVVPADCLATHLKRRLPDANDLKLYLSLGATMSRGTAKTMVEAIAAGTRLRRRGLLISRDRAESGSCDFGDGAKPTVQVSWGDVATAFHSTGIPNIEVHFEALPAIIGLARTPAFIKSFLGLSFMQSLLKAQVDRLPEGPTEAARRAGRAVLVGEARNAAGHTVRSRLRTPEAYTLTAVTAFDAARRVAAGEVKAGFQTPSRAFGPDYILSFDGVTRDDLNG